MTEPATSFAALQAELEAMSQAVQASYEKVLREMCLGFGITGDNFNEVLKHGVITVNGIDVALVLGSLADPWTLQIIIDIGPPPTSSSNEEFYKALLLGNMMMVGSQGRFALNPDTGHGVMARHLSMRDTAFNAEYLASHLNQVTLLYAANKEKNLSGMQFQANTLFG